MYGIGLRTRRSRLLVVYVRYWSTDYTATSLGSRMYDIGARIRRPRLLVVVCTVLEQGFRRPRLLVVYVRYWRTDWTTTSIRSVCTALDQGLDDLVSW